MAADLDDILFSPVEQMLGLLDADPDDAHEIGADPEILAAYVTPARFENGLLVFQEDIPVEKHIQWRQLRAGKNKPETWVRLEYKAPSSRISAREHLIAARWPLHNGWVYRTRFKAFWRDTADLRPQPPADVRGLKALVTWVEQQPFDYWETRKRIVTAGVSRPEWEGLSSTRNAYRNAYTLLGCCRDFDRCVDHLMRSDEVRQLLQHTKDRTLAFSKADVTRSASGKQPRLYEDVAVQGELWMKLSIRQALAGPHGESAKWWGRPVVALVDQIYRGHLNAVNRRQHREELKYRNPFEGEELGVSDDGPDFWFSGSSEDAAEDEWTEE